MEIHFNLVPHVPRVLQVQENELLIKDIIYRLDPSHVHYQALWDKLVCMKSAQLKMLHEGLITNNLLYYTLVYGLNLPSSS